MGSGNSLQINRHKETTMGILTISLILLIMPQYNNRSHLYNSNRNNQKDKICNKINTSNDVEEVRVIPEMLMWVVDMASKCQT